MSITVNPITIGMLQTLPKVFEREIEEMKIGGGIETMETKLATVVESNLKAPLFGSYYTKVLGRELLLSLECATTLDPYNAVLSKAASSTSFWVFGMTRPGIEPRSPGPLANTLTIELRSRL